MYYVEPRSFIKNEFCRLTIYIFAFFVINKHFSLEPRICRCKGQLISKCFFEVEKTNENNSHTSKNEFICSFFRENRQPHKPFWNQLTFSNAIHFLVVDKKKSFLFWKIQWIVVSYDGRIWWVISYTSVSYRKGLRVVNQVLHGHI